MLGFHLLLVHVTAASCAVLDLTQIDWSLTEPSRSINVRGKVPSQAHLDLQDAGFIQEPTYDLNFLKDRWVVESNFTYTSAPLVLNKTKETFLVFDGIDTFANVSFCDQHVASVNNQFRQWTFDVTDILSACTSSPSLKLDFTSATFVSRVANETYQCVECTGTSFDFPGRQFIRKEQMDYGWDWSVGFSPQGIWKPARAIQLDASDALFVQNTYVDVFRKDQINNVLPDQSKPWVLNATIEYIGQVPPASQLEATICDDNGNVFWRGILDQEPATYMRLQGSAVIQGTPKLWWPAGHGQQALYNLTIAILSGTGGPIATSSKRIGFRTVVLNQAPISPEQMASGTAPGANWHFEINGHPIYAKGANIVTVDPFWPRVTLAQYRALAESTVAMNMNMLRIWAGSIYFPDEFYDIADELGIMLWSEMQFSDSLYPLETDFQANIASEVSAQVQRLNSHPSQSLWCANNENAAILELLQLFQINYLYPQAELNFNRTYGSTLAHITLDNSQSISYLPSSINYGYISYHRALEQPFEIRSYTEALSNPSYIYGNSDYYNYNASQAFQQSTYPVQRFANEFGFHSHSSYATYKESLPVDQLSFNSTSILARNRHYEVSYRTLVDNAVGAGPLNQTEQSLTGMGQMQQAIDAYYPLIKKQDPAAQFQAEIYATQVFSAEFARAQIEFYRRGSGRRERQLGSLFWMLNDVWAAPTWSALNSDGSWKVLAHFARELYKDVIVAPYVNDTAGTVAVSVASDRWDTAQGHVELKWYDWDGREINAGQYAIAQEFKIDGIGSVAIDGASWTQTELRTSLGPAVGRLSVQGTKTSAALDDYERFFTVDALSDASVLKAMRDPCLSVDFDAKREVFIVTSRAVAAYVFLEHPRESNGQKVKGFFDSNAFWMLPGTREIKWECLQGPGPEKWADQVSVMSMWDLTTA